jgi:hypothetical protein
MEEQRMERSESFDSIPEIEFIHAMIHDELNMIDHVSEFKQKENKGLLLPEPILIPDKSRFVLFPIKHTDVS